jgi:hypothetical protein
MAVNSACSPQVPLFTNTYALPALVPADVVLKDAPISAMFPLAFKATEVPNSSPTCPLPGFNSACWLQCVPLFANTLAEDVDPTKAVLPSALKATESPKEP